MLLQELEPGELAHTVYPESTYVDKHATRDRQYNAKKSSLERFTQKETFVCKYIFYYVWHISTFSQYWKSDIWEVRFSLLETVFGVRHYESVLIAVAFTVRDTKNGLNYRQLNLSEVN